ncbi:transcriptional repressor LexA [Ferrovibrio sp.]|uniref:transcriptional repressor LexA n=1 Tax=Ferrovibrio sp. TaxID=1917215 RepID=UPI0025C07061|nr:transcriptional repressor LexA [Ferrovibrio sp.]MBX3454979.1 transcriptional repressor LexA [Ferrovibrio sp.]
MLTRKQHDLLMYIHEKLETSGVSPSFEEMKEAMKLKSKSGIHRLVTGLEERGFLRRLAHRARALEVLRLPDSAVPNRGGIGAPPPRAPARNRLMPRAGAGLGAEISPMQGTPVTVSPFNARDIVTLPLYGRIAAGTPIEALRDMSTQIDVPIGLLGNGDHYALEVAGDSMVEAGILDGDTVVIQRTENAENGTIVVALVDENEVTLKRLRRKGNSVALEAANTAYETRIFGPDRVKVQGRLVGLLRRY